MNSYWNLWIHSSDLESLNGSFMEHIYWGWSGQLFYICINKTIGSLAVVHWL